jgi:hypothetical protein
MVDPLLPKASVAFGFWWFIMWTFQRFYNVLSWAPGVKGGVKLRRMAV